MNSSGKKYLSEDTVAKIDAYWRAGNYLYYSRRQLLDKPPL